MQLAQHRRVELPVRLGLPRHRQLERLVLRGRAVVVRRVGPVPRERELGAVERLLGGEVYAQPAAAEAALARERRRLDGEGEAVAGEVAVPVVRRREALGQRHVLLGGRDVRVEPRGVRLAVAVDDPLWVVGVELHQVPHDAARVLWAVVLLELPHLARRVRRDAARVAAHQLARQPVRLLVAVQVGVQLVPVPLMQRVERRDDLRRARLAEEKDGRVDRVVGVARQHRRREQLARRLPRPREPLARVLPAHRAEELWRREAAADELPQEARRVLDGLAGDLHPHPVAEEEHAVVDEGLGREEAGRVDVKHCVVVDEQDLVEARGEHRQRLAHEAAHRRHLGGVEGVRERGGEVAHYHAARDRVHALQPAGLRLRELVDVPHLAQKARALPGAGSRRLPTISASQGHAPRDLCRCKRPVCVRV
mmetsp:Transcript_2707/g.8395  ORF Transcript_2707/g.8395 Transcript_2707/m.8395 type:complete len:423 (-) Transcript_2707:452-1720(-)